jgi:hypothetical protein
VLRARADVRTRVGWVGWVPPGSRAEPDLPRGAFGPWPRASASSRDRCRSQAALSAFARTRLLAGTGEAAARMPGGAPMIAPETGRRRTLSSALRRRAQRRVNRGRQAGRSHRRDVADPCGSAPRADAAPLSNASGSAPSRTGRPETRTNFHRCQGIFSRRKKARTSHGFARAQGCEKWEPPLVSCPCACFAPWPISFLRSR